MRSYRLGQEVVVDWAFEEFKRVEPDLEIALAAGRQFAEMTFRYVDAISEQVLQEYEAERERWLSQRNTVRAAMIEDLLAGGHPTVAVAEQALGYRLHQRHLGWFSGAANATCPPRTSRTWSGH